MDPIVSPWLFYLADVCQNINMATSIILFTSSFLLGIFLFFFLLDTDEMRKFILKNKKIVKYLFVSFFLSAIVFCFMPTRHTVYQMIIASMVTENNIKNTQENIIEFIEKIVDAIENKKNKK